MFRRFVPAAGFAAVFSLVAVGLVAAAAAQTQSDRFFAGASFQGGPLANPTFTVVSASKGTTEFESDTRTFEQTGTFVNVSIFSFGRDPAVPPRFEFGCFQVPDSAFSGSLAGAHLDVTVGPGVGNCGGIIKGDPTGAIGILGGGGGSGGPIGAGLSQKLTIVLDWSPTGAVRHFTSSFETSCLDSSNSSSSTSDVTRASAKGTINGGAVASGPGLKSGASLSTNHSESSSEITFDPACF